MVACIELRELREYVGSNSYNSCQFDAVSLDFDAALIADSSP